MGGVSKPRSPRDKQSAKEPDDEGEKMRKIEKEIVKNLLHLRYTEKSGFATKHLSKRDSIFVGYNLVYYRLWDTCIACYDWRKGLLTLKMGGWNTPTTRSRLSAILQGLGVGSWVGQKAGVPYIFYPKTYNPYESDAYDEPFKEGVKFRVVKELDSQAKTML